VNSGRTKTGSVSGSSIDEQGREREDDAHRLPDDGDERGAPQQAQVEHRLGDAQFDRDEQGEEQRRTREGAERDDSAPSL
jgi:hypothetical protein